MSKPVGYTQEMIDAVVNLVRQYGDGNHSFALRDGIFDLILAAERGGEEREREACAQQIVDYMNEVAVANEEARAILYSNFGHTTNEGARRGDLIAVIRDDLSDAIRSRPGS